MDIDRVTKMLLLQDVVEIDAGDTMVYDVEARKGKAEEEAVEVRDAGEALIARLAPRERAALLLEDVFDLSLADTALTLGQNSAKKGLIESP